MGLKKYQSDIGTIHRIRLGKDNAAVASNTEPAEAVDSNIRVKISKSNREFGLRPRSVSLTLVQTAKEGEVELTVTKRARLPILTQEVYDGEVFAIGATVTIGENVWTISNKNPEDF